MVKRTHISKEEKIPFFDRNPRNVQVFFAIIGVCAAIITFFIARESEALGANILPISTVFISLGIAFQNWRLTRTWKTNFYIIFASYIFSFFAFMPGKHEKGYDLVHHIESWNYTFLAIYILLSVSIYWKKILPKLTE
jgi:hypothetical protein